MINDKHIDFIRLVSNGQTYKDAYRVTVAKKKVTENVCKVKGSMLAKKYAKEIQEEKRKARERIEAAANADNVKKAIEQILTQAEVDAELCKIIKGELIEVQVLSNSGKVFKAKISPTIGDKARAIELYNKRFGSNQPIKTDISTNGQPINEFANILRVEIVPPLDE